MTNTDIASATSIMLGTTHASAMYIGNTLVWSNNTVPYDAEIEYLEGTGTLWIDTLIHPTTGYGFELYGGFTEFNNNEFFGGGTGWSNGLGICTHGGGAYGVIVGTTEVCTLSAQNNVMHLFRVNSDGTVYVDDEYKGRSDTQMPEGDYTMYIFNHSSTKAIRKAKIYYCKIFNSNGLVFDGIPVRVGQTGYMYDKISKLLFSNEGSGDFVLGPDKTESPYDAEVEYLEGTGTQYINTGISQSSNVGALIQSYIAPGTTGDFCILGVGNDLWRWGLSYYNTQLQISGLSVEGGTWLNYNTSGSIVTVSYNYDNDKNAYLDGNLVRSNIPYGSLSSGNIWMFGYNYSGNGTLWRGLNGRIYSCKMTNNGILIRDFIPVRKNGVGYMYDKVSGRLFSNLGTGDFVLGPDKLPSGYTKVEYIASTLSGSLYIDLDIMLYDTLNKNYDIAIKFNALNTGSDNTTQPTIFSCQDNTGSPWPGTFIRRAGSDNTMVGRYIGGSAKDNTIGTMNSIIELTEKTPPAKNVYNYNNSGRTHTWGTSLFCIFNNLAKTDRIRYIEARLYYFKLFVEGTLVRDMVPCINPNNVVGLYDLVNNVFYSSPNGAAFVAGSAV